MCARCAEGKLLLFRPCVSLKYTYPTYPAKPAWAGNRRCGRIPDRFSVRPGRGCWKCRIRWQAGGFRPHQCCKMRLCCQLHRLMQDRGKHLAGTAPGCRKIQNGHALCFGLGKIIIADFGNHKKVPSFNYDCKAACSAAVCRTWLWRIYTIVWAGRGKDIPLLLIVHSLGCFVNKKKTES